jgi:Mg-chelatase subunit ChlD
MNPEMPQQPHDELESSLTALLLGELPHEEAAALHQKLAQDAELAKLYERLKQTINLVRETVASPASQTAGQPTPLKLSDERRQKLLQQFKTVAPKEFVPPRRRAMPWLVPVGIAAALVVIMGLAFLPFTLASRSQHGSLATTEDAAFAKLAADTALSRSRAASVPGVERNRRLERFGLERQALSEGTPPTPPTEAVLPPATPAGSAIVLPQSSEPANVPTTPLVSGDVQAGFAVSGTTRAYYDDALGRAGGVGGANTFGGFAGGAQGKTPAPEGRPTEVAAGDFFFRQREAPAVLDAVKEAEGMQTFSKRSSAPEVAARSSFGRGIQAGTAVAPGAPAPTPSAVASAPATDRLVKAAPLLSTPAPTPALTVTTPAGSLELGRVPLETHGTDKTAGDLGGRRAGTSDFGVASADAGSLNYQWGYDASAQPAKVSSDGEKAPILGDLPEAGRLFRSTADTEADSIKQKLGTVTVPTEDGMQEGVTANYSGNRLGLGQQSDRDKDSLGVHLYANQSSTPNVNFSNGNGRQSPVGQATTRRDEVITAGATRMLTEERVKSVELADDYALGVKQIATRGDAGRPESRGANVQSLGAVGYAIVPPASASVTTGLPAQPATVERYGVSRPARSPIALPSSPSEPSLALKYSSGKDVQQLAAANQPGATPGALGDTVRQVAEDSAKTRPYFEAKRELEELQRYRQILDAKIASEKIDVTLPKTMAVEIADKAAPASAPSSTLWEKIRGKGGDYRSVARIKVERNQSDITSMVKGEGAAGYDPYFIQTESEAIQSEAVLGKVIKDLNLNEAWGKKQGGRTLTTAETTALLKNKLDLRPVRNTSLLEIGVKSDKPEEAANIANAVAEEYKTRRTEQRAQLSKNGITALEERFAEQEQKVREAQKKVDDLRANLNIPDGIADGGPSPLMTADTLRKLESMRIESKAELGRQEAQLSRLRSLEKELGPEGLAQAIPTAASDSLLSSLLEQMLVAEQRLVALEKEHEPTHPDVLKTKAVAEDLHSKIKSRVDGIMLGLDAKVLSTSNALDNFEKEIATATQSDIDRANQSRKADVAPPKPAAPAPVPQPEVQTVENAFSTFSLNVSDVSFKLAAASLEKGVMPEPANVRSEEFINAFDYRDPKPPPGVPVAFAWERAQYPFAQNRDLLRFSIKTAALGRQPGRPLNLVLLLDNSGSMERADRVSIIREALRVLAGQLQPQDKFSVVTFARTAHLWVDGVPGNQAAQVVEEVSGLTPQGGTNLEDAMNLAYQTALRHYLANGVNRVVLLTDGAANLGDVDPEALKQKVEANRKQGIALDCFGIGWEGYNDDLLEVLSRNGDGRYGFVNTPEEAATEFAGQLAGALHVAASDVKVQIEFNPARVTAYRQIGYAKHQLTKEQFRDNTVDAAEIGAAESGNALYVIEANPRGDGPLATVRVRYKVPGTTDYHEHEWPVPYTGNAVALEQASPAMRLAATASAFSEWLVSSPYAGEVSPDRLLGYLSGVPEVYGADARPKKLEWMVRQARSIAGK